MGKVSDGIISVAEVLRHLQQDRYMSLLHAAEYLDLSERTLREHLPEIPRFKFGNKWLFKKSDLDKWMEGFRVSVVQERGVDRIVDEVVAEILQGSN